MAGEREEPIILESAHRHAVTEDDIEVGVVIWWGGEFAIAHALRPARTKYLR